jgi:hypothetical protein
MDSSMPTPSKSTRTRKPKSQTAHDFTLGAITTQAYLVAKGVRDFAIETWEQYPDFEQAVLEIISGYAKSSIGSLPIKWCVFNEDFNGVILSNVVMYTDDSKLKKYYQIIHLAKCGLSPPIPRSEYFLTLGQLCGYAPQLIKEFVDNYG